MFKIIVVGTIKVKIHSAKGRNDFHVRFISRSYRIRGREARTHTNSIAIIMVFVVKKISLMIIRFELPVKKITEIRLMIIILAYSAIKISANEPLLYSVLNPDTSSDSPSAKSNGVRFVSAKSVVNQISLKGISIIVAQERLFEKHMLRSNEETIISADKRIRAILTSYEMVCAILRSAPRSAYFLFETHPAARTV